MWHDCIMLTSYSKILLCDNSVWQKVNCNKKYIHFCVNFCRFSGKRMCTTLVNRLEDLACPVNVWVNWPCWTWSHWVDWAVKPQRKQKQSKIFVASAGAEQLGRASFHLFVRQFIYLSTFFFNFCSSKDHTGQKLSTLKQNLSCGKKFSLLRVGPFDFVCVEFYGPVNPMGSCRAQSVYLTTRLLGRLCPLSG